MSARDNELKVNSEQSLYGYLREFANARECFNFVGTVQLQTMFRRVRVLRAAAAATRRQSCALLSLHFK